MKKKSNQTPTHGVLFLYEGDTEKEFYDQLFEKLNLSGKLPIKKKNLNGNFNLNSKVGDKVSSYLDNTDFSQLTVIVAYDREGPRSMPSRLNIKGIKDKIQDNRLKAIHEIVATQMLESWFFIDIEGIYAFLKAPEHKRQPHKYQHHEKFRHEDLYQLFQEIDKSKKYYKGEKCEGLINRLDLIKIYHACKDLKEGIDKLLRIAKISPPIKSNKS